MHPGDLSKQTEYWSNDDNHKLLELFFSYKRSLNSKYLQSEEYLTEIRGEIIKLLEKVGGLGKLKQNLDQLRSSEFGEIGNLPEFRPEDLAFLPENLRK